MTRPTVYFRTMTDAELIQFTESYSVTDLEAVLGLRLEMALERIRQLERDQKDD